MECDLKESGIYRIEIGPNFYFGSAVVLRERKWTHMTLLRAGNHENSRLNSSYKKYGEFIFTALEVINKGDRFKERLLAAEQKYLSRFASHPRCMNISPTAGNCIGVKHTDAARKNMSRARIRTGIFGLLHPRYRKTHTAEARLKISQCQTGRIHSEEHIKKRMKKINSPENKARRRAKMTGYKWSDEALANRKAAIPRGAENHKSRAVWLSLGGFFQRHATVTASAKAIGVDRVTLHGWIHGHQKWPGDGVFTKHPNLIGLKGGFF